MNHLKIGAVALIASTFMAAGACGGRVDTLTAPDGGSPNAPDGGSPNRGGASGDDAKSVPTTFTNAQVQAALASCNDPHGAASSIASDDDEVANLTGAWLLCPSSGSDPTTMFTPGIVIEPDRTFATLTSDDSGGLQSGLGVKSQGKWSVVCETSSDIRGSEPCSNIVVQLQTTGDDLTPEGCFGGSMSFEDSPRRMYAVDSPQEWCNVQSTATTIDLWLVPLL